MTAYDNVVRTIIDLPKQQLDALARLCEAQKISRAEVLPLAQSEKDLFSNLTGATITCELPNADLYKF
jgi:hypothetical protein